MPYFQHHNVHFHYVEEGASKENKDTIIALHGLAQNTHYWTDTGTTESLAKDYHVVCLDMRGHGLTTIDGEPKGYDVEVMIEDINALANHLGIDRFHLMGHSTGGMVAARYAMHYGQGENRRLHSLLLCNTSASIMFSKMPKFANEAAIQAMAYSFEQFSWSQILQGLRLQPGPLFKGLAHSKDPKAMFNAAYEMMKHGNRNSIADFIRVFYNDPDHHESALRTIECPTLVVTAELDSIFSKTSEYFINNIPNVSHAHASHIGHMTALEDPIWFNAVISKFLRQQHNK